MLRMVIYKWRVLGIAWSLARTQILTETGGQPACNAGLTCGYMATASFEDCIIPSATQAVFTTACFDYPTSWNGLGTDPVQTSFW